MKNKIIGQWRLEAAERDFLLVSLSDTETIDGKVSCRFCDYYLGEISWIRKRNNNYFVRQQQFRDLPDIKEMCALKCKQLKFSYRS
ncbi:unnamed protein product [Rotaria sp. Silwood2]|nr:unnamed protein product [Rotaria sp. Silwood2]CAF3011870.1 unnamed protein product [Rotaria sp. Silwood2]CAF3277823.1 unnamed protein product [Rotaria sp. Silwood2]CAF3364838.1 unnamed protein product [Rotaria sp. Silwood2]CAF4131659.1 unnamed protein product [Rotaria sp. Silwood2]